MRGQKIKAGMLAAAGGIALGLLASPGLPTGGGRVAVAGHSLTPMQLRLLSGGSERAHQHL